MPEIQQELLSHGNDHIIERIDGCCARSNLSYIKLLLNRYDIPVSALNSCAETAVVYSNNNIVLYFHKLGVSMDYERSLVLSATAKMDNLKLFIKLHKLGLVSTETACKCLVDACAKNASEITSYIIVTFPIATVYMLNSFYAAANARATECLDIITTIGAVPTNVDREAVMEYIDDGADAVLYSYLERTL